MATAADLADFLAPIVGLHVTTLDRHARNLREAGFWPDEDGSLTAAHAAVFLAAVVMARAPTETVEAAYAFRDRLPLAVTSAGGEGGWTLNVNFAGTLERLIEASRQPAASVEAFPTGVFLLRHLDGPSAFVQFRTEAGAYSGLYFGQSWGVNVGRVELWASLPFAVISAISDMIRRGIAEPAFGKLLMMKAKDANAKFAGPRFRAWLLSPLTTAGQQPASPDSGR